MFVLQIWNNADETFIHVAMSWSQCAVKLHVEMKMAKSEIWLFDIGDFSLADIIAGPLSVIPNGAKQFDVPSYEEVKAVYSSVKNITVILLLHLLYVCLC